MNDDQLKKLDNLKKVTNYNNLNNSHKHFNDGQLNYKLKRKRINLDRLTSNSIYLFASNLQSPPIKRRKIEFQPVNLKENDIKCDNYFRNSSLQKRNDNELIDANLNEDKKPLPKLHLLNNEDLNDNQIKNWLTSLNEIDDVNYWRLKCKNLTTQLDQVISLNLV